MIGRQRTSRTSSLGICSAPTVWSRHQLLAMLTGVAAMVVLLVVGLVLAVVHALRPGGNPAGSLAGKPHGVVGTGIVQSVRGDGVDPQAGQSDSPADSPTLRDQLASRPLPAVPESASHPSAVSLADPGAPWLLPAATRTGPAGVPTGFAQTPQGAMAQLAAIDTAALSSASLAGARAVITGWAAPGGPTASSWSVIRAIAALLSETDLSGGTRQLAVLPTPLSGPSQRQLARQHRRPHWQLRQWGQRPACFCGAVRRLRTRRHGHQHGPRRGSGLPTDGLDHR